MKFLYLLITAYTIIVYTSLVRAQYGYIGDPKAACDSTSNAAIYVGYSCNAGAGSCKTNITFRSQDPYNTLNYIARLLNVDYNDIAQANPDYSIDAVGWNKLVYVPVTCSCQNSQYYYKFTSLIVDLKKYSLFSIANNTYQGLTTCQGMQAANTNPISSGLGTTLSIPLRCACPTTNQRSDGIISLFSYVVGEGDTISSISTQLKVDGKSIHEANQLPENTTIYPFTTLLIPVINNQSTSESAPSTSDSKKPLSKGAIGGIAALALTALCGATGAAIKFNLCQNMFCCCNIHYHGSPRDDRKDDAPKTKKEKKRQKIPVKPECEL